MGRAPVEDRFHQEPSGPECFPTTAIADLNRLWATTIVEEIRRSGVRTLFVSPGSRSTPLVLAAAESGIPLVMHFDERGQAFQALGFASADGMPAALLCTSGTAAANYLPAVIEAAQRQVPLLILSADRPPELQDVGANQSILQAELFAPYVRWKFSFPAPDPYAPLEWLLSTVSHAVLQARTPLPGPVHLNLPFREPFLDPESNDDFDPRPEPRSPARSSRLKQWHASKRSFTEVCPTAASLSDGEIEQLAEELSGRRVLIAVGNTSSPTMSSRLADAVVKLGELLGSPILADATSPLRWIRHPQVITYFDQLLLAGDHLPQPESILYLGQHFVSKRWLQFMEGTSASIWQIGSTHQRMDPAHRMARRYLADPVLFCHQLAGKLKTRAHTSFAWMEQWTHRHARVDKCLDDFFAPGAKANHSDQLQEAAVARLISETLDSNTNLVLGSSMPIRDMDMYARPCQTPRAVYSNRGASGIEGTLATACGIALASQSPTWVVLGDLAFLHDLNSLDLVRRSPIPLTILVINNDGGGIFSFLPIARQTPHFESLFATPHGLSFESAAKMFELDYFRPQTLTALRQYVEGLRDLPASENDSTKSRESTGTPCRRSVLIEVITDRNQNWQYHQSITRAVKESLASC